MRRDNCQLVRTVVSTCLDRILIQEDIEGAKQYVRSTISDLLMNRLDLSLLVITKVGPPGHPWQSHPCQAAPFSTWRNRKQQQPTWGAIVWL